MIRLRETLRSEVRRLYEQTLGDLSKRAGQHLGGVVSRMGQQVDEHVKARVAEMARDLSCERAELQEKLKAVDNRLREMGTLIQQVEPGPPGRCGGPPGAGAVDARRHPQPPRSGEGVITMHVGIDLGTTFSLIARVDAHGIPVLFPDRNEAERFKTPSVVHIGPEGALVGQAVEELLEDAT